jgi:hypothetical protein
MPTYFGFYFPIRSGSNELILPFIALTSLILNGCASEAPKETDILAITNQASYNCDDYKDANGVLHQRDSNCRVQGKLILTNPTKNLSYVLYRKGDAAHFEPVLCTLPSQAAEALKKIRNTEATVTVPKVSITGKRDAQDTSDVVVLNKDDEMSAALFVLSSSFSLCMAENKIKSMLIIIITNEMI